MIRDSRERAGWTQAELARRAGVSRATVERVETDHAATPRTLQRLTRALSGAPHTGREP